MHRRGKVCQACGQPLATPDSAILMDRDGRNYHVTCWVKLDAPEKSSPQRAAPRKTSRRRTPPTSG